MVFVIRFVTLSAAIFVSTPASAQYSIMPDVIGAVVGNMVADAQEHACLIGTAPSVKALDEVRALTLVTMREYVNRSGMSTPADVTELFTRKTKLREWWRDGTSGSVNVVDDPFARDLIAIGQPLSAPDTLILSGDERGVLAVWHLAPDRHYRGLFRRESRNWKLQRLELIEGAAEPVSATQFCHKPGDVEAYKINLAKFEAERERKKAEKEAAQARRKAMQPMR